MDSQGSTPSEKGENSTPQSRSTIGFPYTDLDSAVEVVWGVHNAGGTACDSDQLAAALKMEAKGGGFRQRLTSTQSFKLITYERGGRITLTDLGRQIIDSAQERMGKMNAFLEVELFKRVFDEFKGGPLPPQAALERALVSFGVGKNVADRARQVLLRSAKQAGFFDAASDRLVKPAIRNDAAPSDRPGTQDADPADQQRGNGGSGGASGGGSGGGNLHPLIQGLLQTLPAPGTNWSAKDQTNWLTLAGSVFKMIYPGATDGEITITLQPQKGTPTAPGQ